MTRKDAEIIEHNTHHSLFVSHYFTKVQLDSFHTLQCLTSSLCYPKWNKRKKKKKKKGVKENRNNGEKEHIKKMNRFEE